MPDNTALMVVASKIHRDQATDDYIASYAVRDMTSAGSSLKFCLVATGEADLYPRLGPDHGMGHRRRPCGAARRPAGRWCGSTTTAPLAYGKPGFENPFFLAYAPGVLLVSD